MTTRAKTLKKEVGRKSTAQRSTRRPVAGRFPTRGYCSNHSGTITTAGQSRPLLPANENRNGFLVQNLSAADLYINDGSAATGGQPSIKIPTRVEWRLLRRRFLLLRGRQFTRSLGYLASPAFRLLYQLGVHAARSADRVHPHTCRSIRPAADRATLRPSSRRRACRTQPVHTLHQRF
jgi:hypothetical protein